jgi:hypothetical protein
LKRAELNNKKKQAGYFMWKVSKWVFLITTLPLTVLGLIFLFSGFTASPEVVTEDGYPLQTFFFLLGGAFLIFPLVTTIGTYLYYKRSNDREAYLIQGG